VTPLRRAIARHGDKYFTHPRQYRDHDAESFARGWLWAEANSGDPSAAILPDDMRNKHFMLGYNERMTS
jgi:hypothetical protein